MLGVLIGVATALGSLAAVPQTYAQILALLVAGALAGAAVARRILITSLPQMVGGRGGRSWWAGRQQAGPGMLRLAWQGGRGGAPAVSS